MPVNPRIILQAILEKKVEKQKSLGLVKTKENANSANLPAIFGKQFGEREYSTPLSALFLKQFTSTQFANRAIF